MKTEQAKHGLTPIQMIMETIMKIKTQRSIIGAFLIGIGLCCVTIWACPCPPCPPCYSVTGSYPNCGCNWNCSGGQTCCNNSCCNGSCCDDITCYNPSTSHCCGYGNGKTCNNDETCCGSKCCDNETETCCNGECCDPDFDVTSNDDVICVGESMSFTADSSTCNCVQWSGGGDPATAEDTCSFTTSWDIPGEKTVTATTDCGGGDSKDVIVVEVESLLPDEGGEIDDGDDDPDTRSFVVCKADSGAVTVTATPNPGVAEEDLPGCWSLTGGTGTGKLSRTVDKTASGVTTITCTAGTSSKTTKVYVLEMTDLTPDQGTEVDDEDSNPNTKLFWIDYDSNGGTVTIEAEYTPGSPIPDANDYVSAASCWSLTGGSAGTATYRTLEKDVPGIYTISGSCYSSFTVTYYVIKAEIEILAHDGDWDSTTWGHGWWDFTTTPSLDPNEVKMLTGLSEDQKDFVGEYGYFPIEGSIDPPSDMSGPGELRPGTPSYGSTASHTWTIPFDDWISGVTAVHALNESPGTWELLHNCIHETRNIAGAAGVTIPDFPGIDDPDDLDAWLKGL